MRLTKMESEDIADKINDLRKDAHRKKMEALRKSKSKQAKEITDRAMKAIALWPKQLDSILRYERSKKDIYENAISTLIERKDREYERCIAREVRVVAIDCNTVDEIVKKLTK